MKTYGTELNVDQDLGIVTNTQRQQPRGMERESLGPAPLATGGWLASGLGKPTAGAQGPWSWLSVTLGEAGTGLGTGGSREPLPRPEQQKMGSPESGGGGWLQRLGPQEGLKDAT